MTEAADGSGNGRSQLCAGSRISGELVFPGAVDLHGDVDGRVSADEISVEKGSSVEGDLVAERIQIKGRFSGRIAGRDVTLHASAQVSGDVGYETLNIESGAEVDIACKRKEPGKPS